MGLCERCLLDPLGGGGDEILEVQQSDTCALEEEGHPPVPDEWKQMAAENDAVEIKNALVKYLDAALATKPDWSDNLDAY